MPPLNSSDVGVAEVNLPLKELTPPANNLDVRYEQSRAQEGQRLKCSIQSYRSAFE